VADKKFILKLLALASNFVYEAIAAVALGLLIGWGIDTLFDLDSVFIIIFAVIGALAAVRNLIVRTLRLGREHDDRKDIR